MDPRVRYFLPSQVRGVYRFDETFGQVDGVLFDQFAKNKLRFLPCSLIGPISRIVRLDDGFDSICRQFSLDANPRDSQSRRANAFFSRFPYFANALHGNHSVNGDDNYLEIQFVKKILAPLLNERGLSVIQPQKPIGPYYVDFAVDGPIKLALEVDGFGKFSHREDLDGFIERQNYIICQGWKVVRFTYGQIMHTTKATQKVVYDMLAADPHYRDFLIPGLSVATRTHQASLFDDFGCPERKEPTVFDLVNGFYRVQDWFAQYAIETPDREIHLWDDMGFPFPLVGLALSSLYHFFDCVTAVVDVEFDLPAVTISSPVLANAWRDHLHPAITLTRRQRPQKRDIPLDYLLIQSLSAFLPVPLSSEESISFRSGLSFEEIHQRLDYVTREVFGFGDAGTKPFQDKVLQRIFDGKDTLGISTTGSGKSFCFWLPTLLKPGLTLVIAPLKSLMRDQRLTLLNYGLSSMEFINSDVNAIDQQHFMEEAKLGYLRLLYISPERLRIKKFVEQLESLQECVPVNVLAIDEAHCISEWGHDFRPSYLKLPSIRMKLGERNPGIKLLALTATAGQQVERDMRKVLKLTEADIVREPMADRERFSYQIIPVDGAGKSEAFRKVLTEDLATALKQQSLSVLLSHHNNRQEKAVGIVFCMYADPHGKNTIYDGTIHYLFESMNILEPDQVFMPRQGRQQYPKYNPDAFSEGRVRAFSSKPPTNCPYCHSYAYTNNKNLAGAEDDWETAADESEATPTTAGIKVCLRCRRKFLDNEALHQPSQQWEKLIKKNQNDFKHSSFDILIATKGFGMGIDKGSVRFVIHTSLSSGIESWYQEVGRAGRDDERAHIVLLVDPPNDSCRSELEKVDGPKRPKCSWTRGCKHGRQSICDYGKQHIFISGSYPGAESDAIYTLRMLDRLLYLHFQTGENPIPVPFRYTDEISRSEIALYRLQSLGLVDDYMINYAKPPRFEVVLGADMLPDDAEDLEKLEWMMQKSLNTYVSHWDNAEESSQGLARIREKYKALTDCSKRKNRFRILSQLESSSIHYAFFNTVYEHLLLLLDHTYEDVVTMRYDMLWNLCNVAKIDDGKCQRIKILPPIEGKQTVSESYRCGCCNVCSPELIFLDRVVPRTENRSAEANRIELDELLRNNDLNIPKLRQLCEAFRDYRTATYARGRAVLEGNPNNLPALYLTREFSPAAELAANTKRFLRTANERKIPIAQVKVLYKTSVQPPQSEILLLLNDQNTACDCLSGWEFLAEEAKYPQHHGNTQVEILRECLDFFLLVEELPPDTKHLWEIAATMEEIINA